MTATRDLTAHAVAVRPIEPSDAEAAGEAGFEAHAAVSVAHNVPPEQPSVEVATGLVRAKMADPNVRGWVAERGRQVAGSVFLTRFPSAPIAAVGPLTVHPTAEGGVGGQLLETALAEARRADLAGVRLVQSPSHLRSLALYTKLGFHAREPLVLVRGRVSATADALKRVRQAVPNDLAACNELSRAVLGFYRSEHLRSAIEDGAALVVERDGALSGYTSGLGLSGHAIGRTTLDLRVLISATTLVRGPGFFVPVRNHELLNWLLGQGFTMLWPALLMTIGWYQEPVGAYLPAISF